ncbi:hypothetical protein BH09SUM1_BH09SUM1_25110 [soil metagenome]
MSLFFGSKKYLAAIIASAAVTSFVTAASPDGPPKPPEFKSQPAPATAMGAQPMKPMEINQAPVGPGALKFEYMATKLDLKEGEVGHIEFPVENTSDKTVKINAVRPSCGCTTATDNPTSLEPGEKSKIKVDFNSTGRSGANHKTVTVETSETDHPSYTLSFEATVTTDLFLSTTYLSFGVIDEGKEATRDFTLTSMTDPPTTIKSVSAEDKRIMIKQGATEDVEKDGRKGKATTFTVTIPANFTDQQLNSRVTIETDYAKTPTQWMTVEARFEGDIIATPNRFYADVMADSDTTRTVAVTLKSRSGREFDVKSVEQTMKPAFKTTIRNGKLAGTKEVLLTIGPKEVKSTQSGRAKITAQYKDTKEEKVVDLTLLVTLRQRPNNPLGHGIQVQDYKNSKAPDGAPVRMGNPSGTPIATIAVPPREMMKPAATTAAAPQK